jgi:hypothetical protein
VDTKLDSLWGEWCSTEPLGHMGRGYGRILGWVGGSFQVIPELRWEMAPRLDYDMTYDMGIWP